MRWQQTLQPKWNSFSHSRPLAPSCPRTAAPRRQLEPPNLCSENEGSIHQCEKWERHKPEMLNSKSMGLWRDLPAELRITRYFILTVRNLGEKLGWLLERVLHIVSDSLMRRKAAVHRMGSNVLSQSHKWSPKYQRNLQGCAWRSQNRRLSAKGHALPGWLVENCRIDPTVVIPPSVNIIGQKGPSFHTCRPALSIRGNTGSSCGSTL